MKALATKPTNNAELLRRAIAVELDAAFVEGGPGSPNHAPNLSGDFRMLSHVGGMDGLVELLASAAERQHYPPELHPDNATLVRYALDASIKEAHITELTRQRDALLGDLLKAQKELAAWPRRALDHALDTLERERARVSNATGPG